MEHNKKYFKKYYMENKEKINKKYDCVCHGKYTQANKSFYVKIKKHQNYLKNLLDNHDKTMKEVDDLLNDIKKFINYLN
jgi:hypothetical protein